MERYQKLDFFDNILGKFQTFFLDKKINFLYLLASLNCVKPLCQFFEQFQHQPFELYRNS